MNVLSAESLMSSWQERRNLEVVGDGNGEGLVTSRIFLFLSHGKVQVQDSVGMLKCLDVFALVRYLKGCIVASLSSNDCSTT